MPKYQITKNYWDNERLHLASMEFPLELDLPATTIPSRTWTPLDDEARLALLDVFHKDLDRANERLELHKGTPTMGLAKRNIIEIAAKISQLEKSPLAALKPAPIVHPPVVRSDNPQMSGHKVTKHVRVAREE